MRALRIGTRGSPLALWQARAVETAIQDAGGPPCESIVIKTTGDSLAARSLSEVGSKRRFVKEIEDALLTGAVDLAVHSAKDLPADLLPGLTIGATLPREDARDALALAARGNGTTRGDAGRLVSALGPAPRLGTGSVRRIAQLVRFFPTARFEPIRGNVETRLRKLDAGKYDALVLATAGLIRLGLGARISARLSVDECVPAPGQGIVAIEIRASDSTTGAVLAQIDDHDTTVALGAERALVNALGGDCQTPLGAIATRNSDGLQLVAVVASLDGSRVLRRHGRGQIDAAIALGQQVAADLLTGGAAEILAPHRR